MSILTSGAFKNPLVDDPNAIHMDPKKTNISVEGDKSHIASHGADD